MAERTNFSMRASRGRNYSLKQFLTFGPPTKPASGV